jgi:hypothetical protein
MNAKSVVFALTAALLLSFAGAAAQEIPAGTVLPVMLNSTLDAGRNQPGWMITGKIMQAVPLPDGSAIPKGSRVIGHVVAASAASAGSASHLTIQFDRIIAYGRTIPIAAHLRALASMNQVFEAKIPTNAWDDYGTSPSDWNTVQVGGAGVYRGNGQVVSGDQVVGHATDYGAVTGRLVAAPKAGCGGSDQEQALWIFSPWACGTYGFSDLKIAHAGKTEPIGQIEFESSRDVHVLGGSGWLLKTESVTSETPPKP